MALAHSTLLGQTAVNVVVIWNFKAWWIVHSQEMRLPGVACDSMAVSAVATSIVRRQSSALAALGTLAHVAINISSPSLWSVNWVTV